MDAPDPIEGLAAGRLKSPTVRRRPKVLGDLMNTADLMDAPDLMEDVARDHRPMEGTDLSKDDIRGGHDHSGQETRSTFPIDVAKSDHERQDPMRPSDPIRDRASSDEAHGSHDVG
jgi:hypothetical protein